MTRRPNSGRCCLTSPHSTGPSRGCSLSMRWTRFLAASSDTGASDRGDRGPDRGQMAGDGMKPTQSVRLLAYVRANPGVSSLEITLASRIVNVTGRVSDLRKAGRVIERFRGRSTGIASSIRSRCRWRWRGSGDGGIEAQLPRPPHRSSSSSARPVPVSAARSMGGSLWDGTPAIKGRTTFNRPESQAMRVTATASSTGSARPSPAAATSCRSSRSRASAGRMSRGTIARPRAMEADRLRRGRGPR